MSDQQCFSISHKMFNKNKNYIGNNSKRPSTKVQRTIHRNGWRNSMLGSSRPTVSHRKQREALACSHSQTPADSPDHEINGHSTAAHKLSFKLVGAMSSHHRPLQPFTLLQLLINCSHYQDINKVALVPVLSWARWPVAPVPMAETHHMTHGHSDGPQTPSMCSVRDEEDGK